MGRADRVMFSSAVAPCCFPDMEKRSIFQGSSVKNLAYSIFRAETGLPIFQFEFAD